jgi:hypothetical protein
MIGGVSGVDRSAARLCHVRSRVLGRSPSRPRLVMSPGPVARVRVWSAAHRSKSRARGERWRSRGDHDGEWRLKSPNSIVGKVESNSRESKVASDVGSSTSL